MGCSTRRRFAFAWSGMHIHSTHTQHAHTTELDTLLLCFFHPIWCVRRYLAQVMQFKAKPKGGGDGISKDAEPELSPWQVGAQMLLHSVHPCIRCILAFSASLQI